MDSPFSDISVMVNDVAYENLKVPSFITAMVMKLLSRQVESKVHFDILKLKPTEFARTCSVPCVFIVGKEDKLVFPKRVQEIFNAYLGKQKSILNSSGDHSSEREQHVIRQCFSFVMQEFKKNASHKRSTVPPQTALFDDRFHATLSDFGAQFTSNYERVFRELGGRNAGLYHSHHGKFNFDVYLDESRNEENLVRQDELEIQDDFRRDLPSRAFARGGTQLPDFSESEILEDLTALQVEGEFGNGRKNDIENTLQDLSLFMRKNNF